ncbi:sodium-dependent glucose transporter 1-like [Ixodes scapularis]
MYYALFGPTVQDLAVRLDADLFRVLFLLAARGIGGFVGALFGGVFLKPVNPQVLFVIFDFFLAMACIGLSYFDTLFQYVFIFAIGGIALGALNIVGVLWMSAMWRENSGFLLQTLSFMHCMGCVLGPVVGEPFLTHRSVIEAPSATPSYRLTYLSQLEDKDFIYVTYAYWVVGIYLFAVVLLLLAVFFVDPRHENLGMMETRCNPVKLSPIIAVLVAYLAVYVAMEILYSQLIASLALLLGHNKTTAAYLTSLFWATFTTVRGVCILWVQQHGSLTVLLICNGLLVLTACLNSGLGYQTRVMWVGTSLVGACLAPVLPSTLLLLHDHSGVSSARFAGVLFVVGASSAISPLCVGAVMERNPMLFYHGFLGLAFISLLLVVGANVLIHRSEAVIGGYISLPMEERRRSY